MPRLGLGDPPLAGRQEPRGGEVLPAAGVGCAAVASPAFVFCRFTHLLRGPLCG